MSLPTIQRHYLRVLRLWPKDALRGLTFQDALRRRMEARFLTPPPTVASNEAQVVPLKPHASDIDEAAERAQLDAMYGLLENRYSKQYPCSERLLRPGFNPSYYEDLAREMEEAPQRSWLKNKWLRWSSIVRFS